MARTQYDVVNVTIASSVGAGGTFTVSYPDSKAAVDYIGGTDHKIFSSAHPPQSALSGEFSIAFGASDMTVTLTGVTTFVAGEVVYLNIDRAEADAGTSPAMADPDVMIGTEVVKIDLGTPATADADGAVASQAATAASGLATGINGALAASDVATFDVPRNVVAAWTGTSVLTVTGTDAYGETIVESSASGTSLTGKKAFKTVTGISVSADVTGLTVGTGTVLGIPVYLAEPVDVLKEVMDGASATAGTLLGGVTTTATATTGDVRGTYVPNSAPNGSRNYELLAALRSVSAKGVAQYAG